MNMNLPTSAEMARLAFMPATRCRKRRSASSRRRTSSGARPTRRRMGGTTSRSTTRGLQSIAHSLRQARRDRAMVDHHGRRSEPGRHSVAAARVPYSRQPVPSHAKRSEQQPELVWKDTQLIPAPPPPKKPGDPASDTVMIYTRYTDFTGQFVMHLPHPRPRGPRDDGGGGGRPCLAASEHAVHGRRQGGDARTFASLRETVKIEHSSDLRGGDSPTNASPGRPSAPRPRRWSGSGGAGAGLCRSEMGRRAAHRGRHGRRRRAARRRRNDSPDPRAAPHVALRRGGRHSMDARADGAARQGGDGVLQAGSWS